MRNSNQIKKLTQNEDIVEKERATPNVQSEIETSIENNGIDENSQTSDTQQLNNSQEEEIVEAHPRSTRERRAPKRYHDYEVRGVVAGV